MKVYRSHLARKSQLPGNSICSTVQVLLQLINHAKALAAYIRHIISIQTPDCVLKLVLLEFLRAALTLFPKSNALSSLSSTLYHFASLMQESNSQRRFFVRHEV